MRHLHFTQSLEPLNGGGLGSSTVSLHRQMRQQGIASVLCATHGGTAQNLAEGSFEFRRINPYFIYYSPEMRRRAPDLVKGADVVHGHGFYTGTNYVMGSEARKQRKPLVYHVHGMFEPYILSRSRWKKQIVHTLFENDNFRYVRLWRALTSKEADQIRGCGLTQPIVVAPNGISMATLEKPENMSQPIVTELVPELEKSRFRALFLGRIHPKKGLDMLVPAWSKLGGITKDWQLIIAGPDELGHMAEIRELVRSFGLEEQVLFTGAVKGETRLRLLHSADLFILPSYSEGFPMGVLEAAACSVPVVATSACNFPDLSAANAGWECEATADSLLQTLEKALKSEASERLSRGRNGHHLVKGKYTWESVVGTLTGACEEACR
ncbi:MAG: glycosyltransferase [Verrucomicrobiota bacterium]|nr:glycosyltransferase [Verrucomicrobiota bacterium]